MRPDPAGRVGDQELALGEIAEAGGEPRAQVLVIRHDLIGIRNLVRPVLELEGEGRDGIRHRYLLVSSAGRTKSSIPRRTQRELARALRKRSRAIRLRLLPTRHLWGWRPLFGAAPESAIGSNWAVSASVQGEVPEGPKPVPQAPFGSPQAGPCRSREPSPKSR